MKSVTWLNAVEFPRNYIKDAVKEQKIVGLLYIDRQILKEVETRRKNVALV